MLDESTKIELSQSLSINKDKVDTIIENTFYEISKILLNGTPFYIENIGTISIEDLDYYDKNTSLSIKTRHTVFYSREEKAYYSTQTLALNMAIKYHEDEQKIREIINKIFSLASDTLTNEKKIVIKNFGDFYLNHDIIFVPSFYLKYLINPYFNLIKNIKTIDDTNEIPNNEPIESMIEEDIVESLDDYSDIIEAQELDKTYDDDDDLIEEVDELNNTNEEGDANEVEEVAKDITEESSKDENTEEVVEVLDIAEKSEDIEDNSQKYDNTFNKQINEPFYRKPQKRTEGYDINIKENTEAETEENNDKKKKKSYKNVVLKQKKERSWIFVALSVAAVLIIISAILLVFYNNIMQKPVQAFNAIYQIFENDKPPKFENNNMYDIAEFYFVRKGSQHKTYVLNRDMYYWEISDMVYGETIYWPFVYAINNEKGSITNSETFLLKKDSQINIAELKSNEVISFFIGMDRDVAQTLAELYFSLYNTFYTIGNNEKAMKMITIAAEIDRNILEQKKYEIPTQIYDTVSANVDHKRR